MRVPIEWLKDFVDVSASPEEVADRLTMAGLEIEGMEPFDNDVVLEVNVTPNRPDCLSILGIAREVAAAFGLPLKMPETEISGNPPVSDIRVEILNPELCNRYTGRTITGVSVGDSPEWIKKRLEKCGIRALNNNVVDITNYVLLELGHPLHAFDADRLQGGMIQVRKAGPDRTITTLDGLERELPEDALLIWDERNPVAVAGVMGGEDSSVTHETADIFLESAYFEPASVRRTSKELGLRSESSYRFERGTDIEFLVNALNRATLLMRETGGGTIHEIVDVYPERYVPAKVSVRYSRVNTLLGTALKKEEMLRILGRIGLRTEDREELFDVYPPAYRRDIHQAIDVIEEVARLHNFGNIPVRIPRTALSDGILNRRDISVNTIRDAMRKAGLTEVINYSFMNPADLDLLGLPEDDVRRRRVSVRNPLKQEDSLMRTTLIPSLINNFVYNLSRGMRDIRLFELARVFIDTGAHLPTEEMRLSGIFFRQDIPSIWKDAVPAFFMAKGALKSLFEETRVTELSYIPAEEVFLHGGKSADIMTGDKRLGFVGELGPGIVETLNLKLQKPEIVVFELNADMLMSLIPARMTYTQIPRYPSIERDIAVIMDDGIPSARVMADIRGYRYDFIAKVELFDHYKGKNIPEGKKSLAFRITYRCNDRTLTDSEVETVHQHLVEHVLLKTGGELRT
ncbi:MAG: phenylalanine--tRNA ligase subunit beta [Nitrospirae bacterium]|nr:phenylalanine--tRNA ligase subunit beta [Nitrospirota bacterium]